MQYNWPVIGEKLYSILKGSSKKIIMYDAKGNETIDPESATRFFATYKSNDKELDTFTILVAMHQQSHSSHIDIKTPNLKDTDDFEVIHMIRNHIRRSVGEKEGIKINWQVFDHAINPREEAVNNIKESKDVSKVYGTTKSSFQRIGEAKLIIRHSAAVNEEKHGARSRHIRALFVENKNGERFAYPHLHVTGARAFARHISNGGTNHDTISEKLFSLSEDYIKLRKSSHNLRLTENIDTMWLTALKESMTNINRKLKSMHGPKGYKDIKETLLSENIIQDQSAIDNLHNVLAENCGCNQDDSLYNDLKTAARYIVIFKPRQEPLMFKWDSKPNLQQSSQQFDNVSQQLHWQLSELAKACNNQDGASRLYNLAEMISNGIMPTDNDLGVIRQAFKSNRDFIIAETPMPEENELNEFFDSFSIDKIFEDPQCNETHEGEECPVHGMEECSVISVQSVGEDADLNEISMSPDDEEEVYNDREEGYDDEEDPDYGDSRDYDDMDDDRMHFSDPGGRSALRAATPDNPRIHTCPTCGHPDRLTAADVSSGYQCDRCADAMERGHEIDYYEDPTIDHDLEGEAPAPETDKYDLYESQVKRLKNLAGI